MHFETEFYLQLQNAKKKFKKNPNNGHSKYQQKSLNREKKFLETLKRKPKTKREKNVEKCACIYKIYALYPTMAARLLYLVSALIFLFCILSSFLFFVLLYITIFLFVHLNDVRASMYILNIDCTLFSTDIYSTHIHMQLCCSVLIYSKRN